MFKQSDIGVYFNISNYNSKYTSKFTKSVQKNLYGLQLLL